MAMAGIMGDAFQFARLPIPIPMAVVFVLAPMGLHSAQAGCWSVLKSPKWSEVQASLDKAKLCEVIPAGPNRTDRISITRFDICDAPGGFRLEASARSSASRAQQPFSNPLPLGQPRHRQ